MDLGVMAMEMYFTFPRSPELEAHLKIPMLFTVIPKAPYCKVCSQHILSPADRVFIYIYIYIYYIYIYIYILYIYIYKDEQEMNIFFCY